MNERIKELAEQANIRFGRMAILDGDPRGMARFVTYSEFEKFTELLVKECVEVCRRQQYYDADDEHKRGVNSGSITCMNAIKQHFGVEE